MKSLYCSLVRSVLEYASCVWCPRSHEAAQRLESIQKQFLLFALRGLNWQPGFNLPSYESRLRLISMDTLGRRRDVAKVVFVRDILEGDIKVPDLHNLCTRREPGRNIRSAGLFQLVVPFAWRHYEEHESVHSCLKLFNLVSEVYEVGVSRESFKRKAINKFKMIPREWP